ncbi:MAG: outer membrane beta-barrel protein [Paludibacteraceae bacterium]|nr:outer membrane beta-barrel protein [Paludibacteraceae bacterium]
MKKILLCLFISLPTLLWAQTHTVQGRVVNKENGELLEMTAVRVFRYAAGDSTLITGGQTDQNGAFHLRVEPGKYALIISNVGYFPTKVPFSVTNQDVNLKSIALKEDVQALGEVQVRGTAAEMTVRGDTLEYNASAYKVNENAMVEDLLKKMSGVEVSSDGSVTINGEQIKAVRIDGKKFFGSDVQTATKNIPADMIEKIQVVDQKSDMAKMTGIEDDDTERIINLTLKQNKKKGLFGNFSGAIGSDALGDDQTQLFHYNYPGTPAENAAQFFNQDFRYNASAFMNLMLGESQTTIVAGANNTNEARSGRGRGWMGGGNRSGITWAENLGVNTNVILSPAWTFGGDASINHTSNHTLTDSEKEQYTQGMTYNNNDSTTSNSRGWDANMRLEFEFKPDTMNTLLIKPNLSYTNTWTNKQNDFLYTSTNDVSSAWGYDTLSYGNQRNESLQQEINGSLQAIYSHRFEKKGRSISLDAQGGITNTTTGSYNIASGSIDAINQHQNRLSQSGKYSVKLTYIEPLYKQNHFLETSIRFEQTMRKSSKDQYNLAADGNYTDYDADYSNSFRNIFFDEQLELNYRYLQGPVDLTVGVRANPSQTHSTTTYATGYVFDTLVTVWNFAPRVNLKYKLGKKQFARIFYRGNSQQPSVSQMEPVRDNSNAMSETVGNLGLNPAFRHMLRAFFSSYNADRMSSINTGVRANITKDALVYNTLYDETGKAFRQTVNAKGTPFDVGWDLMYNTPVVKNRLHFFTRTALGYNQRLAYVTHGATVDLDNFALGDESRTGNLSASEDLSLRFSHDVVDLGVRGNVRYSRTQNNQTANITNTIDWGVTADFNFHLPYNWTISTDIGYNDKWGYGQNLGNLSEIMWNAKIDKTWKAATLSLNFYDILNQKKNVIETIGENYIQYQRFNTLPTYFTLSFTYKLNRMGDLKAKGHAGFMQEMMEGGRQPGRPGGTPPGPPPFMR